MARTKIVPTEGLLSDLEYTSVIVSYSNGIDSTGALYWAVKSLLKLTIAVQAYSGALVQFQQGGFGSRHGEPAPEGSRLIAASGYRGKIAAVIPAREYVDGQQVFCGFLVAHAAHCEI